MKSLLVPVFWMLLASCTATRSLRWVDSREGPGGSVFYKKAAAMGWTGRDSLAMEAVQKGNMPAFNGRFVPVVLDTILDKARPLHVVFYVSPDYFSVGNDLDWARVPLTAAAARLVLDQLRCFAPTPALVNLITRKATVHLEPVPLFAFRDSTPTFWHHHLIIEGQRCQRPGLIAGIKKDIVFVSPAGDSVAPRRVGIYGWQGPAQKPIQPFYQGHAWWYADYSHGLRLVSRKIRVNGDWVDIDELLKDPLLRRLLF